MVRQHYLDHTYIIVITLQVSKGKSLNSINSLTSLKVRPQCGCNDNGDLLSRMGCVRSNEGSHGDSIIMEWFLHPIVMATAMEKWVSWQQVKVLTMQ